MDPTAVMEEINELSNAGWLVGWFNQPLNQPNQPPRVGCVVAGYNLPKDCNQPRHPKRTSHPLPAGVEETECAAAPLIGPARFGGFFLAWCRIRDFAPAEPTGAPFRSGPQDTPAPMPIAARLPSFLSASKRRAPSRNPGLAVEGQQSVKASSPSRRPAPGADPTGSTLQRFDRF
jgi:hypothetical protein